MTTKIICHAVFFFAVLMSCGAADETGEKEAQQTIGNTLYSASWSPARATLVSVRFPASQPMTDNRLLEIASILTGCTAGGVEDVSLLGDVADIKVAAQCVATTEVKGPAEGLLLVQVATFADTANAKRLLNRLAGMSVDASAVTVRARNIAYNRIYVGPVSSRRDAFDLRNRMRALGFQDAFIVRNTRAGA